MRYAEIAKEYYEATTAICFAIPSVVDRHYFHTNPDPAFHFHADPDPISDPDKILHRLEKEFFFTFFHSSSSVNCFFFLVSVLVP
jgi:hypothetical protein